MLHIDEQTSFEGRITEFEMQYIKIKNQSASLNVDPSLNAHKFIKNKISALKAQQIQILKNKIKQIQHKQTQSSKYYQQEIAVLQDCIKYQQTLIHQIKIQMMEFKKEISELRKDTKIVHNFVCKSNQFRRSMERKQMRNTSPSFMTNNINKMKSSSKDKIPLTFSAKDARQTMYTKLLLTEDNFKNLSTVQSKKTERDKTKK